LEEDESKKVTSKGKQTESGRTHQVVPQVPVTDPIDPPDLISFLKTHPFFLHLEPWDDREKRM